MEREKSRRKMDRNADRVRKENRFQAFKVSLCGNQIRRDYQPNLTLEQARAFPLGRQEDAAGPFIWTYSVMNDYPQSRG
jgi:hypothetical protein